MSYAMLLGRKRAARKGDVVEFPGSNWQDRVAEALAAQPAADEAAARARAIALRDEIAKVDLAFMALEEFRFMEDARDAYADEWLEWADQLDALAAQADGFVAEYDSILATATANGWTNVTDVFYEDTETPSDLARECRMNAALFRRFSAKAPV